MRDEDDTDERVPSRPSDKAQRQRERIGDSVGRSNPPRDEARSDEDTDQVP